MRMVSRTTRYERLVSLSAFRGCEQPAQQHIEIPDDSVLRYYLGTEYISLAVPWYFTRISDNYSNVTSQRCM